MRLPIRPTRWPRVVSAPELGSAHPITAHYSFNQLRKNERLSWPSWLTCSGRFIHISGNPSCSCRSSVGQGQFAGHRPTFYHCATQPTFALFVFMFCLQCYLITTSWWIQFCIIGPVRFTAHIFKILEPTCMIFNKLQCRFVLNAQLQSIRINVVTQANDQVAFSLFKNKKRLIKPI